jgi:phosphomannomutase
MTQIKFGTDGWRAIIADDFTVANVARVSVATAQWLLNRTAKPSVVIGHDCRFGGELFVETAAKIFCSMGVKVLTHKGFVTTPMVSLATVELKATAGVVITASHNPPTYNGYKLKDGFGGPAAPSEIAKVEAMIPASAEVPNISLAEMEKNGLLEYIDMELMYVNHVNKTFDLKAIAEKNVLAYDAMYGAGQRILPRLLPNAELMHCTTNPGFMGQPPEPLERNTLEFQQFIKANKGKVSAGLVTDGDADRIAMYDENGNFLDAHHILLLLIYYASQFKGMSGKVVVAFSASDKIKKMCKIYGLPHQVTKIGFKYIAEIMMVDDVLVGGEESGGIAVKGHIPERDGIWDGLLLLDLMTKTGKTLTQLVEDIYAVVGKFVFERNDLHLEESLKQQIIANCKAGKYTSFGKYKIERVEDIDGYKYHLADESWVMIRPSGTEPLLRIYAEAPTKEMVLDILTTVKKELLG